MTLQERLNAIKEELAARVSPEAKVTMRRATEELKASGLAQRAVGIGQRAPAFELRDANDTLVRSEHYLARGPLVVSFYRGVWCPYCNAELRALQEALGDIRDRGAELLVISPQTPANSRRSARAGQLEFPILFDEGNLVANEFGLRFRLPDDLIELYKKFGNNLAVINGDDSWTLPMPARFVIGSGSIAHYAEVNPDYTVRPDPRDLLPVLETIGHSAATSVGA